MKANLLQIRNILGIKEIDINLGSVTYVKGKNGKGKSSVVEALKSLLDGGGHEATLLKNGEEKGEIVLVLDDGSIMRKVVKPGKSSFTFEDQNGRAIASPVARLRELVDSLSANPVSFLTADKKERAKVLLEALNPDIDRNELEMVAGELPKTISGFDLLEFAAKKIFDDRTGENRLVKESLAAAKTFRDGLLGNDIEKIKEDLSKEKSLVFELLEKREKAEAEAKAPFEAICVDLEAKSSKAFIEIQDLMDKVSALQTEIALRREQIKSNKTFAQNKADISLEYIRNEIDASNSRIRELDAELATANREAGIKEAAEKSETKAREADERAKQLTEDLGTIEQFRKRALETLPIKGLEIKNGEVFFNEVVFDRLNTAKKIEIAIEVAKLRAGALAIIPVDGIEAFDSETLAEFEKAAVKSGVQFVVTCVSDSKEIKVSSIK